MGGRWYYNRKPTTQECCSVSIFNLNRRGALKADCSLSLSWTRSNTGQESSIKVMVQVSDNPHVRFIYTVTKNNSESSSIDDVIRLGKTECNFGGVRYWFICNSCWRRVAVLYLAPRGYHFVCRRCNNLSYQSQNDCLISRVFRIEKRRDELQAKTRNRSYRGIPTRKTLKVVTLNRKVNSLAWFALRKPKRFSASLDS